MGPVHLGCTHLTPLLGKPGVKSENPFHVVNLGTHFPHYIWFIHKKYIFVIFPLNAFIATELKNLKLALSSIETKAALIWHVVKCKNSFLAPHPVDTVAGIRKHG